MGRPDVELRRGRVPGGAVREQPAAHGGVRPGGGRLRAPAGRHHRRLGGQEPPAQSGPDLAAGPEQLRHRVRDPPHAGLPVQGAAGGDLQRLDSDDLLHPGDLRGQHGQPGQYGHVHHHPAGLGGGGGRPGQQQASRHERHGAHHRPADQHPGAHAGGPDHGVRLALHRLRLHRRLEPGVHVSGVRPAVEGLPEDAGAGVQGRPEGGAAGAQAAQPRWRAGERPESRGVVSAAHEPIVLLARQARLAPAGRRRLLLPDERAAAHPAGRLGVVLQAEHLLRRHVAGLPLHDGAGLRLHHHGLRLHPGPERLRAQPADGRLRRGGHLRHRGLHLDPPPLRPDPHRLHLRRRAALLPHHVRGVRLRPRQPLRPRRLALPGPLRPPGGREGAARGRPRPGRHPGRRQRQQHRLAGRGAAAAAVLHVRQPAVRRRHRRQSGPLVLRPDGDAAHPGERDGVGARRHQRRAELHELPAGPAALHHGDPGAQPRGLRPAGPRLRVLRGHGTPHVLPLRLPQPGPPPLPVLLAGAEGGGGGGQPLAPHHRLTAPPPPAPPPPPPQPSKQTLSWVHTCRAFTLPRCTRLTRSLVAGRALMLVLMLMLTHHAKPLTKHES